MSEADSIACCDTCQGLLFRPPQSIPFGGLKVAFTVGSEINHLRVSAIQGILANDFVVSFQRN